MAEYRWLVGWYATRRHAVPALEADTNPATFATLKALCGAFVFASDKAATAGGRDHWRTRLMERKPPPRCKHCERKLMNQ